MKVSLNAYNGSNGIKFTIEFHIDREFIIRLTVLRNEARQNWFIKNLCGGGNNGAVIDVCCCFVGVLYT